MTGYVMGTLDKKFVEGNIKTFDDFHGAILDIFNDWETVQDQSVKKEEFIRNMKEKINPGKLDDSTLIIGIATPPAAMAAKRAGENVPQLGFIKAIPDVVFVPSATILTLFLAKLTKRMLQGSTTAS
ncbi:unnamed protein product [Dovyalis caffra]|uniref:Uncharacterized protein n=1 Tax=Dovyalis caffra TaxID=77055 RepID=A0AAV1RM48_9ROSI|nr:unnamed protein product [Dovyalis caffra]